MANPEPRREVDVGNDWQPVLQTLNALGSRVEEAGLVYGAISSGFLARCRGKTTAADLASATGLDRGIVTEVCGALLSLGVLVSEDDEHMVVSELYAPLLEDGVHQRALDQLAAAKVRSKIFADLFYGKPTSYWGIDSASRLALAAGATGDPQTEFGRKSLVAGVRADPEWDEIFTRGGRFLDLGCGVAGAIASFLDYYPRLTAVGIDVAEDVLEAARARARALGVDDRATFVLSDAASFRDHEPFDVIFWPQTFYPETSRPGALASSFANLRPGGLLVTAHVPPRTRRSPADPDAVRDFGPLLRRLWGIDERSPEALRTELEDAGFVNITVMAATPPILPLVKARRPSDSP
jgi:SAM-dependent methyltransferase